MRESGGTIRWEFPMLVSERAFVITARVREYESLYAFVYLSCYINYITHTYSMLCAGACQRERCRGAHGKKKKRRKCL